LYPAESSQRLPAAFREDDSRLRTLVPKNLAALAEPFEACQWRFLEAVGTLPEALELALDNPVLAYAIVNNNELTGRSPTSAGFMAIRYFRGSRRRACAWLGFPGRQTMVNIFKRTAPEAAHPSHLRMLCMRLNDDPDLLTQLAHLPRIHLGVMALVIMPQYKTFGTPKLLQEVAAEPEEAALPLSANMIQDWLSMINHQGKDEPSLSFVSLKRARELHEEENLHYQGFLAAEQAEQERLQRLAYDREFRLQQIREGQEQPAYNSHAPVKEEWPFPLPPIPGTETIVPITTPEALRQESLLMSNCVATFEARIRHGLTYFYQILKPQRGTLQISCRSDGVWMRSELKKARNRAPTISQIRAVDTWLWEAIEERNKNPQRNPPKP
jgi:hypothetical protein